MTGYTFQVPKFEGSATGKKMLFQIDLELPDSLNKKAMEQSTVRQQLISTWEASIPRHVTWVATGVTMERAAARTIIANPSKPPDIQTHSKSPINKTRRIRSEK